MWESQKSDSPKLKLHHGKAFFKGSIVRDAECCKAKRHSLVKMLQGECSYHGDEVQIVQSKMYFSCVNKKVAVTAGEGEGEREREREREREKRERERERKRGEKREERERERESKLFVQSSHFSFGPKLRTFSRRKCMRRRLGLVSRVCFSRILQTTHELGMS